MSYPRIPMLAVMFLTALVAGNAFDGRRQQTAISAKEVWKWYSNVRFQYAICYPENLLIPEGESENGDGQKFRGEGGARLIVYGQNNALHQKLTDVLAETQSRLAGRSGKVTYKRVKSTWFVVTGLNGPTIFDAKTIYTHGQFKSFEVVYDRSWAAVYSPVVRHMNMCFTDLDR
jgi:hypothetical protein